MQVCFALMCVSFIGCYPHQGGDLICAVCSANSGVQGGAWNLAAWNLPTCAGKSLRRQSVGCPPCWAQSAPLGNSEVKDARRQRAAYLVGPFCREIPRKPTKKDKHVQPAV